MASFVGMAEGNSNRYTEENGLMERGHVPGKAINLGFLKMKKVQLYV
jgi:hypothetical protein